jgi:two-component system response regulator CpxR
VSAASGRHGLRILEYQEVELILVNIFMPDMDGIALIQALRQTRPASKIIAITSEKGLKDFLDTAKQLGVDDTLQKPFTRQECWTWLYRNEVNQILRPFSDIERIQSSTSPSIDGR